MKFRSNLIQYENLDATLDDVCLIISVLFYCHKLHKMYLPTSNTKDF